MGLTTRLKVECQLVGKRKSWDSKKPYIGTVELTPVTDSSPGDSKENESFFAATPSGQIKLDILNQAAVDIFKPGATYIVSFELAEDSPVK